MARAIDRGGIGRQAHLCSQQLSEEGRAGRRLGLEGKLDELGGGDLQVIKAKSSQAHVELSRRLHSKGNGAHRILFCFLLTRQTWETLTNSI